MNLSTLQWDQDILNDFGIPIQMLPKIVSSSEVYGPAKLTAIAGVAIAGDLGDQQAALVGQACFKPGEAKNTYGTGCFMLMNTGEKAVLSNFGLLTTVAYKLGREAGMLRAGREHRHHRRAGAVAPRQSRTHRKEFGH